MSDWSQQNQEYPSIVVSAVGPDSLGYTLKSISTPTMSSAVYPTSNLAIYIPFLIRSIYTAAQMFVYNGTAVSGNMDVGIYDTQGNRLVSKGSTAQSGTSVIQSFDITDTVLIPGVYYMAVNMDNTTGQLLRTNPAIANCRAVGVLAQAVGAVTLPNPATFAATTVAYIPFIGITSRTVI